MGRKPNPIIGEYFTRGPKLTDSSNRYPHTCKLCGENFPKGRGEVLHKHITEKCPAISPEERINAALGFAGLHTGDSPQRALNLNLTGAAASLHDGLSGVPGVPSGPDAPETWSALRTLAEASRQVGAHDLGPQVGPHDPSHDLSPQTEMENVDPGLESHQHHQQLPQPQQHQPQHPEPHHHDHGFELQEQFTLDHPPPSYEMNPQGQGTKVDGLANSAGQPAQDPKPTEADPHMPYPDDNGDPMAYLAGTTEERLEHLQAVTQPSQPPQAAPIDSAGLAVAVAAAAAAVVADNARLDHAMIEASLADLSEQAASSQADDQMPDADADAVDRSTPEQSHSQSQSQHHSAAPTPPALPAPTPPPPAPPAQHHPWGEMSYVASNPVLPALGRQQPLSSPIRGGTRMTIGNGLRSEHKRKAYNPVRRKEVQAARKKGACIRCRILRKTCGLNDPCDQCRKIQGPRHWTYPCIRTHLSQALTLYSAGLIVVLAQNRVNQARSSFQLLQNGTKLRVSLWNDSIPMSLASLVTPRQAASASASDADPEKQDPAQPAAAESFRVVMIDQDTEDLPARMETYLAEMLPLLIDREPSQFIRVVLDFAQKAENKTGDLLKRAIDLWGLVEILDRERSWCIFEERQGELVPRGPEDVAATEQDIYNLMTWQLSAAAERKANAVSHKLVSELQRCLENGKTSIHFDVYLAILILLHCLEKTTWTIKVWEMEDFRQRWPLERPPSAFTAQGHEIAELLKMLLTLRKAHPKTFRGPDGRLAVADAKDPVTAEFFNALNLHYDDVVDRLEHCAFSPESSRSLEFYFSGLVLLPHRDADTASQDANTAKHDAEANANAFVHQTTHLPQDQLA